jgi:hypothetical protein
MDIEPVLICKSLRTTTRVHPVGQRPYSSTYPPLVPASDTAVVPSGKCILHVRETRPGHEYSGWSL